MKRLMAMILWIVVLLPGTMSIGRDMAKEAEIENQLGSIKPDKS
jgi:hypothetical protein